MKACLVCVWFVFSLAAGQQPTERPAFEVASIKSSDPNPSNAIWIGMTADAGMVRYTNITLKDCIRAAYRVRDFQIEGPDWINDARFEITAKLPPATSPDQIPEMLQVLLGTVQANASPRYESTVCLRVNNRKGTAEAQAGHCRDKAR